MRERGVVTSVKEGQSFGFVQAETRDERLFFSLNDVSLELEGAAVPKHEIRKGDCVEFEAGDSLDRNGVKKRAALELVKLEQAAATATVTGRMKGAFSPLLGGAKKVASIAGNVATRIE